MLNRAVENRVAFISHTMDDLTFLFDEALRCFNQVLTLYTAIQNVDRSKPHYQRTLHQTQHELMMTDRRLNTFVNLAFSAIQALELSTTFDFFTTDCIFSRSELCAQIAQFLVFYFRALFREYNHTTDYLAAEKTAEAVLTAQKQEFSLYAQKTKLQCAALYTSD